MALTRTKSAPGVAVTVVNTATDNELLYTVPVGRIFYARVFPTANWSIFKINGVSMYLPNTAPWNVELVGGTEISSSGVVGGLMTGMVA